MRWPVIAFLAAVLGLALWLGNRDPDAEPRPEGPREPLPDTVTFVGSETCKTCHEDRHETWLQTGHAYSLRRSDEGSVAGRFDGQPIEAPTFTATPYRKDGGYFIRIDPKDGRPAGDHKVTRVVGRTFEQAYLFTSARGEWRVLPICWSLEHERWDLTHEVLDLIGGHPGQVTAAFDTREKVFNDGCGQCHATNYDVGHDAERNLYKSTMLEGAVACESCHGPGSIHTAWHRQDRGEEGYDQRGRLLHPKRDLDAQGVLDSCGRCHYLHDWRYAIADDPRVPYHDIAVSLNSHPSGGFFADGRLSGQRYHGTTQAQSPCFLQGGMSCLHCHRMHSGTPRAMRWEDADTDAQCAQCHEEEAAQGKEHTFHEDVRCVDCHMPRLVEGVLHFMRDHRIRSPEPELTQRYGADHAPNACNACHKERTATWAREWREKWWGGTAPQRLVEDTGLVVALHEEPDTVATARLVAAVARPDSERFFRMTALNRLALRLDEPEARAALRGALADEDVDMVQSACLALIAHPDPAAAPALLKLLAHPARTVRTEAVFALARAGWRHETHPAPDGIWEEAVAMLDRQTRFASAIERLSIVGDALGRNEEADQYTQTLVRRLPPAQWSPRANEVLHRFARRTAEAGQHELALQWYARVQSNYEALEQEAAARILVIDSADSLVALGRGADAAGNWRFGMEQFPPETPVHIISKGRLLAHEGKVDAAIAMLDDYAKRLEKDPAGGETLRRVRWSLRVLAESGE